MKTIQEQIEVMTAYKDGKDVEKSYLDKNEWVEFTNEESFNWVYWDYRIKEQKKTIIIEKWLCKDNNLETFTIIEANNIDTLLLHYYDNISKIKLLEAYEVEL